MRYFRIASECKAAASAPYHRLGQDKYTGLGREYPMGNVEPPTRETMQILLATAEKNSGLECQIGG